MFLFLDGPNADAGIKSAKRPHEEQEHRKPSTKSALMGKLIVVVELFIYVFSSPHIISHSIMLLFCFPSNASRTHFSLCRFVAQLAIVKACLRKKRNNKKFFNKKQPKSDVKRTNIKGHIR